MYLTQGHPYHTVPSEPAESNPYVEYIYDMFSNILRRLTYPRVRVDADSSIVISFGSSAKYTSPADLDMVIAYTLCIYRMGSTDPADVVSIKEKEFLAAITTFDYKGTAVRDEGNGLELWFSMSDNLCSHYTSVYTAGYEDVWNEVATALGDPLKPQDLCYSLYISLGHEGGTVADSVNGFEYTDYNGAAFPSTFRIDFNYNFRSSIFYATWRHPYKELRFG